MAHPRYWRRRASQWIACQSVRIATRLATRELRWLVTFAALIWWLWLMTFDKVGREKNKVLREKNKAARRAAKEEKRRLRKATKQDVSQ